MLQVARFGRLYGPGRVFTGAYPALATDAAPPLAAVLLCAEGESSIEDVIFERRFGCAEGFAAWAGGPGTAGRVLHIRPGGAPAGAHAFPHPTCGAGPRWCWQPWRHRAGAKSAGLRISTVDMRIFYRDFGLSWGTNYRETKPA